MNWRRWLLAGDRTKRVLARLLRAAADKFSVRLLAGVIMSNHFHVIAQSPPEALFLTLTSRRTPCRHVRPWPRSHQNSSVIAQFMRFVRYSMSMYWRDRLDLTGRCWESDYDARAIEGWRSLVTRIAYDHRNPVKEGICVNAIDYAWSSAREWATGEPGHFPIDPIFTPLFDLQPAELRAAVKALGGTPSIDRIERERLWDAPVDSDEQWIAWYEELEIESELRHWCRNDPT